MATTKTQRARAPKAASSKAVTTRKRRESANPEPPVVATMAGKSPADGGAALAEQWLELAALAERTSIDTARTIVDTVEKLPLHVGEELLELLGTLAHIEYGLVRTAVGTVVNVNLDSDVDVGVNVDVLSQGVHTDVLSGGVHVNTLSSSRAAT